MLRSTVVTALIGLGAWAPLRVEQAPEMRALIIAVSDYNRAIGYKPLNARNDVPRIAAALQLHGFDSTNIKVVSDAEATREGILQALHALADAAQPGDVVVIHYSGHGDRLTDNNGDELDGLDELLVPVDAPYDTVGTRKGTYTGQRHIRDDELQPIIQKLRSKVWHATNPGNVTIFIDACFSGTVTRGDHELPARGTPEPLGAPATTTRGGGSDQGSGAGELAAAPDDSRLAPMVVMSAARQDQLARETRDNDPARTPLGAFTLALTRVLSRSPGGDISYRAIMHQVAAEIDAMGYSQRPQLEGDADADLFSGRSRPQTSYYRIRDVRSDSVVRIQAGTVLGVMPGAEIAFYPVGTRDPDSASAPAIARGTVSRSTEIYSDVVVPAGSDTAQLNRSWAFMTKATMGDARVRVLLDASLSKPQRAALASALDTVGLLQLVASAPDLVVTSSAGGVSVVVADNNQAIAAPVAADAPQLTATVTRRLITYTRGQFLKERVHLSDPAVDVRLELVPVRHFYDDDGACERSEPLPVAARMTKGNEWELRAEDGFKLKLNNVGKDNAYVTVLYVMPNGAIHQLFPRADQSQESNYLHAGRAYEIQLCFTPDDTPGAHMIKLFATREPVNFEPILARRADPTRGSEPTPLEQMLGDVMGSRDPGSSPPARGTGTTTSMLLHIVPD